MNGILYMDVSVFEDVLLYEKGKTLLSAERRMYMEKLKNPKAASLSLGAGRENQKNTLGKAIFEGN